MSYLFAPDRYEADGFVLRSYDVDDAALHTESLGESYEHLRTFMRWAKPDHRREHSDKMMRQCRGRYLLAQDFAIGIFDSAERRHLGSTGFHLHEGPLTTGCADVGMWVRASEAHRGLGEKVLTAMLRWGFSEWPWQRLAWRCDPQNVASVRVAEKAGLRRECVLRAREARAEGERRDMLCFGLTKDEWLARDHTETRHV